MKRTLPDFLAALVSKITPFKNLSALLMILLLMSGGAWGQVANYAFNSSSGTYTPITGGTVVRTGSLLDSGGATVTLPTAFPFNGASITSIRVNDDDI